MPFSRTLCSILISFLFVIQIPAFGQSQSVAELLDSERIRSEDQLSDTTRGGTDAAETRAFMLDAFYAGYEQDAIVVSWSTSAERNNARFEVERSVRTHKQGMRPWESLVFVAGHGTSDSLNTYAYFDKGDLTDVSQLMYRLKQVSFDGSIRYTEVIEAKLPPPKAYMASSYADPYARSATIEFSMPAAHRVRLKVYDEGGRLIKTLVNGRKPAGRYRFTFDASKEDPGLYMYRLEMDGRRWVEPILLIE